MKAKQWVEKYKAAGQEDFVKAFIAETAELIALRTKNSGIIERDKKKIDTKPAATEGALREQRQKWFAVCKQISSLTPEGFDTAVETYLPEVAAGQRKWRESLMTKQKDESCQGEAGRKLATSLG